MSPSVTELLAAERFFADLPPQHLAAIGACGHEASFKAGDYLLREGDAADYFYLLRGGRVAIQTTAPGHGVLRLETLHAGEVIGWSWLFAPYRYAFDAEALDDCRVIALDGRCLREKCESDHELGYPLLKRFAQVMVERLSAARLQLLDIYASPQQRRGADAP